MVIFRHLLTNIVVDHVRPSIYVASSNLYCLNEAMDYGQGTTNCRRMLY